MYAVVHLLEQCEHYNDRDDREHYLESGARWGAALHNGLIHGVQSARGPCATVVSFDALDTSPSERLDLLTDDLEVTVEA